MSEKFSNIKNRLKCNVPVRSNREGKKKMVKACQDGEEKLIHFGASDYKSNYSTEARKNFRARHNCDTAKDKLSARHWACKALWSPSSPVYSKGKGGSK
jgi:hypothetical protein